MHNPAKHTRLLFVTAALLLFSLSAWALGADDANKPEKKQEAGKENGIEWVPYDVGLAAARESDKHSLIDFTAKWCGYCKKMKATTFADPEVIDMLRKNFITVKVDGDSQHELDIDGYKITERNLAKSEYGIRGYPTYWFLTADGIKLGLMSGYQHKEQMMQALTIVAEKKYDTTKVNESRKQKK